MIIYLFLLIYIFFLSLIFNPRKCKKNRKKFVIFAFLAIFLINGLRNYTVGTDFYKYYYPNYIDFRYIPWKSIQSVTISGDWEIGFCILSKILSLISTNFCLFTLVTSFLITVPYAIFIYDNSEDVVFSTLFYILFNIMFSNMNVIRQALAVSFVLLGVNELKKDKTFKYFFWTILALLFHKSAIIAFIFFFFKKIKFTKNKVLLSFCIMAISTFLYSYVLEKMLNVSFFSDSYSMYSSGIHSVGYFNVNSFIQFFVPLICFILGVFTLNLGKKDYDDLNVDNESIVDNFSDSFLLLSLFACLYFRWIVFYIFIVGRFSMYFVPFIMIVFPRIITKIKSAKNRLLVNTSMYSILLLYFFYILLFKADILYGTVPFEFFFN